MSSVISLRLRRNMFSSSCGGSKWCGATGGTADKGFGDRSEPFSVASLLELGNFEDESSAVSVVIFVDSNDSQLNATTNNNQFANTEIEQIPKKIYVLKITNA